MTTATLYAKGLTVEVFDKPPEDQQPVVDSFTAAPAAITVGSETVLSWATTLAERVEIDHGVGTHPANGSVSVTPTQGTVYTLLATGHGGTATATSSVSVTPVPEPVDPPADMPVITQQIINPAKVVTSNGWCGSGARYLRYQMLVIKKGATWSLDFHGEDFAVGGAARVLSGTNYGLLLDGVEVAQKNVAAGTKASQFDGIPNPGYGWHEVSYRIAAGETAPKWALLCLEGEKVTLDRMPSYTGSYDVIHHGRPHSFTWVPTTMDPPSSPLTPRECPEFSEALPKAQLFRTNVVPCTKDDIHRPNLCEEGEMSTFNRQAYDWSQLIAAKPAQAMLDGPRGVGTISMPTHCFVGHTGSAFVLDPWREVQVTQTGYVRTLYGYRHPSISNYWEDPSNVELVGIGWDLIRPPHEMWGNCRDEKTLELDPDAEPIHGLQPHKTGPRWLTTDSQNNRVLNIVFVKDDFLAPPTVTEFLTDISDAWDIVALGEKCYLSERTANRVTERDINTGEILRIIAEGPNGLATLRSDRTPVRNVPLSQIQAQKCCLPEGLYIQDGFLYMASMAMGQVRKIDLTTLAQTVVCSPTIDGNSKFMKIALSDGTFGPRGTVFTWTWSNANNGWAQAHLPDGTKWTYQDSVNRIHCGRGGSWEALGYGSAGGLEMGRLYCGSSEEGFVMLSKALDSDPAPDYAKYKSGRDKYMAAGYQTWCGETGDPFYNVKRPFGVDPDIDYFLTWNGHQSG